MALGAALDNCVFLLPEDYLTDRLNNYFFVDVRL